MSWARTTIYGLTYSGKDGEKILPCFMPLMIQNHGKMCMRFKIVKNFREIKGEQKALRHDKSLSLRLDLLPFLRDW